MKGLKVKSIALSLPYVKAKLNISSQILSQNIFLAPVSYEMSSAGFIECPMVFSNLQSKNNYLTPRGHLRSFFEFKEYWAPIL